MTEGAQDDMVFLKSGKFSNFRGNARKYTKRSAKITFSQTAPATYDHGKRNNSLGKIHPCSICGTVFYTIRILGAAGVAEYGYFKFSEWILVPISKNLPVSISILINQLHCELFLREFVCQNHRNDISCSVYNS